MPVIEEQAAPLEAHDRTYGWIIIAGSIAALGGMAVHPTGGGTALEMVRDLIAEGGFNAWLHGLLMAVYLVLLLGFYGFSLRLGMHRPLVQGGLIAYAAGVFAAIAAAISVGLRLSHRRLRLCQCRPGPGQFIVAAFRVAGAYNFAWGRMWMIAISAAILLWSLAMRGEKGAARAIALLGIAVGIVGAIGIPTGLIPLTVIALVGLIAAQTLWSVAVGVLLVRGKI